RLVLRRRLHRGNTPQLARAGPPTPTTGSAGLPRQIASPPGRPPPPFGMPPPPFSPGLLGSAPPRQPSSSASQKENHRASRPMRTAHPLSANCSHHPRWHFRAPAVPPPPPPPAARESIPHAN